MNCLLVVDIKHALSTFKTECPTSDQGVAGKLVSCRVQAEQRQQAMAGEEVKGTEQYPEVQGAVQS